MYYYTRTEGTLQVSSRSIGELSFFLISIGMLLFGLMTPMSSNHDRPHAERTEASIMLGDGGKSMDNSRT